MNVHAVRNGINAAASISANSAAFGIEKKRVFKVSRLRAGNGLGSPARATVGRASDEQFQSAVLAMAELTAM